LSNPDCTAASRLADVQIYLAQLAAVLGVDLDEAVTKKTREQHPAPLGKTRQVFLRRLNV
jgi:hypothetical protein